MWAGVCLGCERAFIGLARLCHALAPCVVLPGVPERETLGAVSTEEARAISSCGNHISLQSRAGTEANARGSGRSQQSLKGGQAHKFEEWKRIAMATKYFSVKKPGTVSCSNGFLTLGALSIPQAEGSCKPRPPSDLCFKERDSWGK